MLVPKPLILFIDAYDSFSNNIISLLETTLEASVRTIKIDNPALASDAALHEELRHYVAVVCGPGPGHPEKEGDVGIMRRIWRLSDEELLPVLGICLGFQSLCLEFGGEVKRLKGPQHGMIRRIIHIGESAKEDRRSILQQSIFTGVGEIKATLYQSLCADIDQDSIPPDSWNSRKWDATDKCPQLLPLAWVESSPNPKTKITEASRSGVMDDRVLVAVRHATKPFWALQYHPESICTDEESKKVIYNWFCHALWWNRKVRTRRRSFDGPIQGKFSIRESLLATAKENLETSRSISTSTTQHLKDPGSEVICHTRTIFIPSHFPVPDILEAIQDIQQDQIVLESSNANEQLEPSSADVRGRYSIIGLNIGNCMRFEYTTGKNMVTILHPTGSGGYTKEIRMLGGKSGAIWPFLAQYLDERQVSEGNMESPFWGGFMGYTTYELGLETIDVKSRHRNSSSPSGRPDLCFAWVTRSLVVDHRKNVIYLQQLAPRNATENCPSDLAWIDTAAVLLQYAGLPKKSPVPLGANNIENGAKAVYNPSAISAKTPENSAYENKVHLCQESIRSGDSYELCLTDQTIVTHSPSNTCSWNLYKTLRTQQPAPFASYLKLGPATLISSSPERFLTWSSNGKCSLRPMKGTVKKSASINTLEKAKELLNVPKEKAENLMIVDLVRHDLHSVCGPGNVSVPRLMVVEEYKSVFQMISVVEGIIPIPFSPGMEAHLSSREIEDAKRKRYTGIDVLAASLPPGSMTGAPKKRSCEILQEIEERERGLYSGVVGYMDVGGRGDWSVTIRSMFKWEDEDGVGGGEKVGDGDEDEKGLVENWYIGAGGAVTALSTEVGEREEMLTKLSGTLGVFR